MQILGYLPAGTRRIFLIRPILMHLMAKKNKGKVVPFKPVALTAENYIKNQARSLPIHECLITEEWESAGMCSIIIARKHVTGNITAGIYLIDMFCLGVKDADYRFNMSPYEYQDLVDAYPGFEQCDYSLAHNIIFGALVYAEDYGFKPHKDFAVAKFILEDDDDESVPLMELEFGLNGEPCYVAGPHDSETTIRSIIATLNRTAGEGNFRVMHGDDDLDDDAWDDDEDDLDDFDDERTAANLQILDLIKKTNETYNEFIDSQHQEGSPAAKPPIGTGYALVETEESTLYETFDNAAQEAEFSLLKELVFEDENYEHAITELLAAIEKYPQRAQFYALLHFAYTHNDQFDEGDVILEKAYNMFADHLPYRVDFADTLLDQGREDEFLAVFENKADLADMYPGKTEFNIELAANFYGVMCRYYSIIGDIPSADRYMEALLSEDYNLIQDYGTTLLKIPVYAFLTAKFKVMDGEDGDLDF